MSTGGPVSGGLDQSFFRIATECAGVLKDFCRGQRSKAKKALQRLAQEHPNSFLPHRYLARLLYHESARVEADQQVSAGTLPSHRRLALLHSALLEAKQASELAPGSLSSAALRATLLVNLLVEESALQGGLAIQPEQPPQSVETLASGANAEVSGPATAVGSGDVAWYQLQPEARCEAIKREFREAIAHCVRTLECNAPLLVEPVITISDAHARTCDPCCLRVQDSIVEWVKQDNWQRIVAEKRSVLACMHQVLESCHTLLDSTHIPVDGIVRLLQHILRPHQQDLQLWASQLLLSKGSVDELQHKFETQAAVTELLRMLRPGRPGEEITAGVSAAQPGVAQAQQGKPQLLPAVGQAHASANAIQQQQQQQQVQLQQQPRAGSATGHAAAATADGAMAGRVVAGPVASQALPPPPQQELSACLSAEQEWDEVRDGIGMPSAGTGAAGAGGAGARRAGGKAKNKAKGNDAGRGPRKERSRYERYMDVETFWRTTPPEQRRALLKVPMAALLKGVRREQGNDAVDELIEGLVLLREQGNRAACYWLCPVCEQKFHSSRDFLGHVEMVHEGLAVQDNKYVCCYKCQQDVVGMYYTSTRTAGYNLCFRCYTADAASVSSPDAFEKVFMRHSASRPWSSHSDFMSTRGSFSSLSERSHRHQLQQQQQQQQALGMQKLHPPAGATATGSGGHVHSAACRHHPHCPHHSQGHAHGQSQHGLESTSPQPPLTFGEASDEWLAPLPAASLSAPLMVPDPRAGMPAASGAATLPPPHGSGLRSRGKRSSGGSDVSSSDGMLGQPLHSRSLSEPPNHGRQAGGQGEGAGGPGSAEEGADGGGTGGSSATWRSWWPTRLMQGWAGKGQPQQQAQQGPGQQPQQQQQQQQQQLERPGSGGNTRGAGCQGAAVPDSDSGGPRLASGGPYDADDGGSAAGDGGGDDDDIDYTLLPPPPQPAGGSGTPPRTAAGAGATDLAAGAAADGFGGRMNGMVAELMTRLREIYLTDRDLGDMSLGSITQFVYRKLGAGAAADDLHLASCPPGPRAVLLEFLAQPSIVFQRPQALAVVLGLLPLADLQMVAAYAVRQHEEAVSGAEAAARDIAAGSDEDGEGGPEEEEDEDGEEEEERGGEGGGGAGGGGGGSGSEQEYQLELAARREAARAAAAEAAMASHLPAPMPRARRRLRYTSRRAPAPAGAAAQGAAADMASSSSSSLPLHGGQFATYQTAAPGTPPLPPHAGGGGHAIGGSHALNLRRVDDDASAEEVSEEEMESAVDVVEYALGPDGEALPLRSLSPHRHHTSAATGAVACMSRSQQHQLEQLRHAGGAGMHLVAGVGPDGGDAILCDHERSMEGSLEEGDEEEVSEDVEGEGDEEEMSEEEEEEEEEDGVSLVPDEEDEEEDGPCVSLFNVAGDVELGFDRLITQMWGGGAENDEAAVAALEQPPAATTGVVQASGAGGAGGAANSITNNNRSRSQQQGSRGGRNQQQGRHQSPTSRAGGGGGSNTAAPAAAAAAGALVAAGSAAGAVALTDDPLLAEELVGPREDEPYLVVADWWLQHLRLDGGGPVPDELRVLRWVYGNIINVQAEEFSARQRELRGGRDRDTAILDLYDEVAAVWRSLQAVTDKRSRLEALRRAARGHFAVVRRLEESGGHATLEQATEFLDAVLSGYCQGQQGAANTAAAGGAVGDTGTASGPPEQPGTPTASEAAEAGAPAAAAAAAAPAIASGASGDGTAAAAVAAAGGGASAGPSGPLLYLCERAVEVVRRHPALAQEPSQRYAAALLERELSVLALVEVMVAAEAEEAARERGVSEESLKRHRAEHRDAEAEYQRVQAEGPASHRKKDLLDKATKEAEHREQLRELAARLASLSDNIAADEASKVKWAEKQEEAERELAYVRDAIRQTSARRASLLDVCATLDVPFAPPPPNQQRAQPQPQQAQQQPRTNRSSSADQAPVDGAAAAAAAAAADADVCSAALALGPPSGGGLASAAADMEWRATRLECLMYRVLWVSEAVKMFQPQYSPRQSTHHYDLFIRATHWAKQLSEEYEESIRAYCCELERLRARLRDVAAVDLGYEIGAAALEVVRRRIEAAARAAREAASLTLLKELEEEEERRKAALAAAKDAKEAGGGAGGGSSKKAGVNKKAAKATQDSRSRAQKEKDKELARQAEEEARRRAEEEDKERVAAARRAREAALEAELERRRRELEELEAQREAEAIRAAQEASLREQQLREQREREQREKAAAAAGAAAAAQQLLQQQQQAAAAATAAAGSVPKAAAAQVATPTHAAAAGGGRKQEAPALQPPAQPQQQARRQAAVPEPSPEKPQPKRNAAHGARGRGPTASLSDRSPAGSPESAVDSRVGSAAVPQANGPAPSASARGGVAGKAGGAGGAAATAVSNPVSPPQAGAQVAANAGAGAAKARQAAQAQATSPPSSVSSPAVPDSAAAAAVAAATAGIGKATQGAGARSSPAKQSAGGLPGTPPAGSNASRRQQQHSHQQQHQHQLTNAPTGPGVVAPPGAALPPGAPASGAAPAWGSGAPAALQHQQPQQPVPQLPVPPLDATHGPVPGSPSVPPGPLSPGSEFPPLSVAAAVTSTGHRPSAPAPQLAPPPQQQMSFAASQQIQMHMQAQAQAQAHAQAQAQAQAQAHQAHVQAQVQAHAQAQAQAQAFAETQARLMALAQGPAAIAAAAAAAAAVQQQQSLAAHGEGPMMLPSEHLHAQLRQQQQLQQSVQHHYRQLQQQQQHLQQQQQLSQQLPPPSAQQPLQPLPQQQQPPQLQQQQQQPLQQVTPQPLQQSLPQQQSPQHLQQQAFQPSPVRPPVAGVAVPVFDPFAENPLLKALTSMETKAAQPASPSGGNGGVAVTAATQQAQHVADRLLGDMQGGSQCGSALPGPDPEHIMSIMSILDQDGQSPSAGSGPKGGLSQQAARASPAGTSGSAQSGPASQTPTANSSPQRALMPPAPPPGPPASMYGNPYGMAGAAGGPALVPASADGSPGAGGGMVPMAGMASPAAARLQPGVQPNGPSMGLGGNGLPPGAMGATPVDALTPQSGAGQPGSGLASLPASAAFGSAIWRPGGEQLGGPGSQLPMGMLGLGLGLGGIGTGPNTWSSVGLGSAAAGMVPGMPRSSSAVMASPRQASSGGGGDWGASPGGGASGAGGATGASASARDGGMGLPDSVDTLVASLPTTLLPTSLDADPVPSPSPPPGVAAAAAASGLAPTAAPFYPASLRSKVGQGGAGAGGSGGGGGTGGGVLPQQQQSQQQQQPQQQQQQQQLGGVGAMGMGMAPMGVGVAPMSGDSAAAWMSGLVPVPGKQGAAAGAVAGAAAAAAAAMTAAAANGLVAQGQQQLSGPGGMPALPGVMGSGGMRYGMGLYNGGDGVNWSHGAIMAGPGGMMSAPGVPVAVRATSSTWAPFVPPAGGLGPSQQQFVQQAAQQQAAQQPQQMAGWPRGQRWRN